jgi:hypothetical protein
MRRRRLKLWAGIGAATIAGAGAASPVATQAQQTKHGAKSPPPAEKDSGALAAPKSGEAYLTDGGPRDTRIRIYRDIALMRGHLLVGAELIELGRWDDALPHFLHPTEELYGLMERYIKLHKVPPFDRQLKAQGQAVKARNKAAYLQAAKVVDERLTAALEAFKRFMTTQPPSSYAVRTIVEVLKVAQAEYEASIEGGKFTKPVEYQDSRGFVLFAERLMKAHEADLKRIEAARYDHLLAILAELKTAWPAPMPPEAPVLAAEAVAARAKAFEAAAERFY